MEKLNLKNINSVSTYGSEVVDNITKTIKSLDIEYYSRLKVSEELYKELKASRYDLIFLIRSGEKEVLGEKVNLSDLIIAKEKLAKLKDKNDSVKAFEARINELYHVLSKATSKEAFYASRVDYSKKIKRSMQK